MPHVVGFVLAGGRSVRFGANKARAPWRGKPLLLHAVELLDAVADRVCVVAKADQDYRELLPADVPQIADGAQDGGPLEGLRAALASLRPGDVALLAPCDVVGIEAQWLASLLAQLHPDSLAAAFRHADRTGKGGGWEPLHAAYRQEVLAQIAPDVTAPHRLLSSLGPAAQGVDLPRHWHRRVRRIDTPQALAEIGELSTDRVAHAAVTVLDGQVAAARHDMVAVEQPLEIRLLHGEPGARQRHTFAVTLRTPGHDAELIAGLLVAEGLVRAGDELLRVSACDPADTDAAVWTAELAPQVRVPDQFLDRKLAATAACGLCGKGSLEALFPARPRVPTVGSAWPWPEICTLTERMRAAQSTFEQTGGLHAAAIFGAGGRLLCVREDVGRHNAVDKAIGWLFLRGRLAEAEVLVLSGRAGVELVHKAAMARIGIVVAIGAPTSLAIELAQDAGITLAGFVRGGRGNLYCGDRITA